jgi:hypothetical protein
VLEPRVSVENVDKVVRELKQFKDSAIRELRSDLKTSLNPVANQIAQTIQRTPPITSRKRGKSQMAHRGRTRWRGVNKPVVEFRPGKGRRGGDKLVNIRFTGGSRGLGFDYAELAGIRRRPPMTLSKPYTRRDRDGVIRHRLNGQGDAFIEALAEQTRKGPGRFMFLEAIKRRPVLVALAVKSLNDAAEKVNRRFKVRGA